MTTYCKSTQKCTRETPHPNHFLFSCPTSQITRNYTNVPRTKLVEPLEMFLCRSLNVIAKMAPSQCHRDGYIKPYFDFRLKEGQCRDVIPVQPDSRQMFSLWLEALDPALAEEAERRHGQR